jgi:hypothetical protein
MMRLCAVMMISLLGSLISVQASELQSWSVGFHELTFLDPLDSQPMHAYAFYPSTDDEHITNHRHGPVSAVDAVPWQHRHAAGTT